METKVLISTFGLNILVTFRRHTESSTCYHTGHSSAELSTATLPGVHVGIGNHYQI